MGVSFEDLGDGASERPRPPFADLPRTHVLIADDERASRRLCATYCDLFDFTWAIARSAAQAAAALRREPFDAVVLNVNMEGAASLPGVREVPIVGLAALGRGDEAQRWLAAGLAGVIAKPVTAARLYAALTLATSYEADAARSWAPTG